MDVIDIIGLGLEQLTRSNSMEFPELNTKEVRHSLIHDLKNMVIDIQNLKKQSETQEEAVHSLLLENKRLKVILEDMSHELSKLQSERKPPPRRRS